MPGDAICPDPALLNHVLLGLGSDADAERIELHLLECAECVGQVRTAAHQDWLAEALKSRLAVSPYGQRSEIPPRLLKELRALAPEAGSQAKEPTLLGGGSETDTDEVPGEGGRDDQPACSFLAPAEAPDEMGRLGQYRVLWVLETGGMGVVFHAEDPKLRRAVALKVMRPEVASREGAGERFLREARGLAAIECDHVVPVYHVGEERGAPFLAMPLLNGQTLESLLQRDGPVSVREALRIAREAGIGLSAAHREGLVHRDVQERNIFLEGGAGRVKLLDFGLVRSVVVNSELTSTGMLAGTPHCMSPEQARCEAVDARSDVFSLGCVLYRMLTGRAPFKRNGTTATLLAVTQDQPPPPHQLNAEIPPEVASLVMGMLAKDPDGRPETAQVLVEQIEAIEQQRTRKELKPARRPPHWRVTGLLLVAAAIVSLLGAVIHVKTDRGTLTIEVADPRVEVAVREAAVTLHDTRRNETYELTVGERPLPSGRYAIRVNQQDSGLEFSADQFVIRRGDERRIFVRLTRSEAADVETAPVEAKQVAKGEALGKPAPPVVPFGADAGPVSTDVLVGLVARPAKLPGVRRWQLETARPRSVITEVKWHPVEPLVACATRAGQIRLYDVDTLQLVGILAGHRGAALCLAWSPDGKSLAAGYGDHVVRIWRRDGRPGPELIGHGGPVQCVDWSPDGEWLVSGDLGSHRREGDVRVWKMDGSAGRVLGRHGGRVSAVAWSRDGRWIASGGADKQIRLWIPDGTPGPVFDSGMPLPVSVAWSPDSRSITSVGGWRGGASRIWNVDGSPAVNLVPEDQAKFLYDIAWNPDGEWIAIAGWDSASQTRLWRPDGTPGPIISGPSYHVAWSPDGKRLAAALNGYFARPFTLAVTSTAAEEQRLHPAGAGDVRVGWSPDGKQLASAAADGTVRWWQADGNPKALARESHRSLLCLAWSPDGQSLATGGQESNVRIWNPQTQESRVWETGQKAYIHSIAWLPENSRLATVGGDLTLKLGRPGDESSSLCYTHKARQFGLGLDAQGQFVAASPDGQWLAAAEDGGIQLIRPDGDLGPRLDTQNARVLATAWSADGRLAAGTEWKRVLIWEDVERQVPRSLAGHGAAVQSVDWNPGGTGLVSGSADGTVRLWKTDGTPGPVIRDHTAEVISVSWNPQNGTIASGTSGSTILCSDAATGDPLWTAVLLAGDTSVTLSARGEVLAGDAGVIERELVYIVEADDGRTELLSPFAFRTRFSEATAPRK